MDKDAAVVDDVIMLADDEKKTETVVDVEKITATAEDDQTATCSENVDTKSMEKSPMASRNIIRIGDTNVSRQPKTGWL